MTIKRYGLLLGLITLFTNISFIQPVYAPVIEFVSDKDVSPSDAAIEDCREAIFQTGSPPLSFTKILI